MELLCIREARHNHVTLAEQESPVKIGETYHLLHQQVEFGILYYALIETGMGLGIDANCFVAAVPQTLTNQVKELIEN